MAATHEPLRVDLRGRVLGEDAALIATTGAEHPLFLTVDRPPPVGSIVRVSAPGGEAWAFEVRRVAEVAADGPTGLRGCWGRRVAVDPASLGRALGSEHLGPSSARASHTRVVAGAGEVAAPPGASVVVLTRRGAAPPVKPRQGRARG